MIFQSNIIWGLKIYLNKGCRSWSGFLNLHPDDTEHPVNIIKCRKYKINPDLRYVQSHTNPSGIELTNPETLIKWPKVCVTCTNPPRTEVSNAICPAFYPPGMSNNSNHCKLYCICSPDLFWYNCSWIRSSSDIKWSYVCGTTSEPLVSTHLGQLFDEKTTEFADRTCIVSTYQGISKTFAEVRKEVDLLSAGFLAMGMNHGDRLGIWGMTCYEWYLVQFAAVKAGLILVRTLFIKNELFWWRRSNFRWATFRSISTPPINRMSWNIAWIWWVWKDWCALKCSKPKIITRFWTLLLPKWKDPNLEPSSLKVCLLWKSWWWSLTRNLGKLDDKIMSGLVFSCTIFCNLKRSISVQRGDKNGQQQGTNG